MICPKGMLGNSFMDLPPAERMREARGDRLRCVVPPPGRQLVAIYRRRAGMLDTCPARHPLVGLEVERYDIGAAEQQAVISAHRRFEILLAARFQQMLD